VRTTALIAAFIPGASPPEVITPILATFFSGFFKSYQFLFKIIFFSSYDKQKIQPFFKKATKNKGFVLNVF
jgi:hypothetical protein